MLLNFSFSNYRSFRDSQQFSFEPIAGKKEQGPVRVAAVYGANATGLFVVDIRPVMASLGFPSPLFYWTRILRIKRASSQLSSKFIRVSTNLISSTNIHSALPNLRLPTRT